jgi:hypothetical protein
LCGGKGKKIFVGFEVFGISSIYSYFGIFDFEIFSIVEIFEDFVFEIFSIA